MATTIPKGSTTPDRNRRSGSTSPASFTRRPTKPTTPDKPSSSTPPNSSTTPKQHLPTYHRYSSSSLTKPNSFSKKPHVSDTAESKSPKPPANRRRSFDKPPSPSGLKSLLTSLGRESKDAPPHRSKPLTASRSVSNVPKSTSKPVSSTPKKVWKSKSGSSTSTVRSPTSGIASGSSKKDSRNTRSACGTPSGTSRIPRCRDITAILNLEASLDAMNRREIGEVDKIESIVEDNCPDLPDPKLGDEELDEQHQHHASDNVTYANSANNEEKVDDKVETIIKAENNAECQHDKVEEVNHISKDNERNEDNGIDQGSDLKIDETKDDEAKKEEKEEEEVKNVEVLDGRNKQEKEQKPEVDQNEVQNINDVKEEAKPQMELKAKLKPKEAVVVNAGSNKKEAAPVYNAEIEETASKLMSQEKKWNKVKALVGAFETVIDYESGSKS